MSKTRKQYDREFKVMAVELSKGRSGLSMIARELEIRPDLFVPLAQGTGNEGRNQFSGVRQSDL